MSYDPRLGAGAYSATDADRDGQVKKGSVRAARERMQAAQKRTQLPDTSKIIGLPRRPNQLVSQYSHSRAPPTLAPDTTSEIEPSSPSPQWPLPTTRSERADSSPSIPSRSPKRLQPPRQDPRPLSEASPVQELSPNAASPISTAYQTPNDMLSPGSIYSSSRPITTSSIASDSSIGSIPDFPVPQLPMPSIQQTRRFPSIGPPPSARKGPSSYYTQMSYVSPIVEESESHSTAIQSQRGSFASSNVFPSNRDAFYPDDEPFSDDEASIDSNIDTVSPTEHDDQRGLVQQSPALVRQASLGRRTKPSLMTIRSAESSGEKTSGSNKTKSNATGYVLGAAGLAAAALAARDSLSSGGTRSPLSREASSDSDSILQSFTAKGAASGTASPLQQELRPVALVDRAGLRRPPRLDIDAVRDAEARGSLTSLPDLIRRATRLASNLDRGRTASRLNMDFWEIGSSDKNAARQSGLSEILAAFPPPGQETPVRSGWGTPSMGNGSNSQWPSVRSSDNRFANAPAQNTEPPQRRKCCGMPLWLFITLLIVLFLIIAAAVILPVVLVVLPNQNKTSHGTAAQDTQGSNNNGNSNPTSTAGPVIPAPTSDSGDKKCLGVITCQNGGVAILNADMSCSCICINGFTGRTCANNDATGCTTTNIAGAANNATMGSGIPRLIEEAPTNFKVPLNATLILSLFSSLSLSCAAENALITFNGLASRSVPVNLHPVDLQTTFHPSRTRSGLHHPHPAQLPGQLVKRQTVGQTQEGEGSSSPNSDGATSSIFEPISSTVDALDLGRIAVLLVLQESRSLDKAANAQETIQALLTNNRNGNSKSNNVDLGPFTLDLVDFAINFHNGTTIEAKPSSTSTS